MSEDFVPISRDTSPLVQTGSSPINNPTSAPKKQKTVFRKPFQAHKHALSPGSDLARSMSNAPATAPSIPQTPPRDGSTPRSVKPLRTHASAVKTQARLRLVLHLCRPDIHLQSLLDILPRSLLDILPRSLLDILPRSLLDTLPRFPPDTLPPSPRGIHPVESHPELPSRRLALLSAKSHLHLPPPPPHRVAISRPPSRSPQPSPSPQPPSHQPQQYPQRLLHSPQPPAHSSRPSRSPTPLNMNDRYVIFARTPSPGAQSTHSAQSDAHGNTPSPLRDAMEDVMTSLEDMGLQREPSPVPRHIPSPSPPDAYDEMNDRTPPGNKPRPLTSLGINGYKEPPRGELAHRNSVYSHDHYADGPPQLNNYVQRMESRLRQLEDQNRLEDENGFDDDDAPPPPPKHASYHPRNNSTPGPYTHLKHDNKVYGDDRLNRSFTTKSTATTSTGVQSVGTNLTSSTDKTSQSLMSGYSAGGFSATSAGSYARRNGMHERPNTAMETLRSRGFSDAGNPNRPESPMTGISYHSSHNTSRQGASSAIPWSSTDHDVGDSGGVFGGLSTPKTKKQGFFKKILESAKTGAASARSSISVGHGGGSQSPTKGHRAFDVVSPHFLSHSSQSNRENARDAAPAPNAIDWVHVRRDVNRASSPSRNERIERAKRCQMMDHPVIYAVEELYDTAEGDESIDGLPISEPTNFVAGNLNLVDKSARFISSLPPLTNPMSLAQGYICRPYKSDVQRLRAIFTWVSEKIAWEEPVDGLEVDMKRVLHAKRASPQEIAILVNDMCAAVGLHTEVIHGFLKCPGDALDLDSLSRPNHWWNTVLVEGEWRIMDCALANPTNPMRNRFVTNNSSVAESWYFLTRPMDICYTHVPLYPEEQHICPPISPDVLLALPAVCPQYFKMGVQFPDYDTSVIRLEGLECLQICLTVPPDVECAAEVEAPAFARDADGDFFESGDIVRKRAPVQPDWFRGQKRITVKAVLPGDEGQGVVKIYAGEEGPHAFEPRYPSPNGSRSPNHPYRREPAL
ncbi:hypothetical protein N7468_008267 [Penicillium chermesinum]|uniref:Transglutaminase-like domain-containing protein n=1 Tax=Penicillium chermesinum TaxID=63820 RepID=A0A9W9NPL4_9EURO|nr:uncharacterized protein N7468_008267 [Penicillium chermesinum]KAJ5223725.1 hypothetical protein N7468_008267 [Penicillium chermesinum]